MGKVTFLVPLYFILCRSEARVRMTTGRGGDGFHYPIPIPVKKIHFHPHTQIQRVSNFCLIPTG